MISIFTLLLFLFVFVMCLFLWLVRREIVYRTVRNRWVYLVVPFLAILVLWFTLISQPTADELAKGVLSALIFISFLLDSRGITEDGLVLNSFDKKGVPFSEINKIVLYQPEGSSIINAEIFCINGRVGHFFSTAFKWWCRNWYYNRFWSRVSYFRIRTKNDSERYMGWTYFGVAYIIRDWGKY